MTTRQLNLLRMAAVLSSLVLMGMYVAWRSARAAPSSPASPPQPASVTAGAADPAGPEAVADEDAFLFSGSKSDRIILPGTETRVQTLPGSKSMMLVGPDDVLDASEPPATQPSHPDGERSPP